LFYGLPLHKKDNSLLPLVVGQVGCLGFLPVDCLVPHSLYYYFRNQQKQLKLQQLSLKTATYLSSNLLLEKILKEL
jgi:hypothetical protein